MQAYHVNLNVEKVLVIKHGALGDLIQANGVLKDIREFYPSSIITILTSKSYVGLMQRCPFVDNVIIDDRAPLWRVDQQIKLKKKLQQENFTRVIDLQNSDRSRMYRKFWFAQKEWIGRGAGIEPVSGLAGLVNLLTDAEIPLNFSLNPEISWMADDVNLLLKSHSVEGQYIALIPGSSSQHLEKRWPYYADLATLLMNHGQQVVVILGPDECDLVNQMPGHIMCGLNWFQLTGILNEASFVIGNDTGPSHIASCLNKHGLAIFGPKTSAVRSEIGHRNFKTLEVENLAELSASCVFDHFLKRI